MSTQLQTLCKWRAIYQMMATMGERNSFERYVRDVADKHLLLRAEVTALSALLLQKGVFTQVEFAAQLDVEAEHLCEIMAQAYPGFRAMPEGLSLEMPEAQQTMEAWTKPNGFGR